MLLRLQKILSGAGVASRRAAEQLMRDGRVSVNGQTALDPGTKADPEQDDIRVDGRRIKTRERPRYILLNKPRGYVTTRSDPQRRPTVLALIEGVREYVYPVGRLDFDSEGLLLLTNDGELAARLTHPRHEVARVYEARVRGVPEPRTLERLARGVVLDGRRTAPAVVRVVRELREPDRADRERPRDQAVLEITIREGRNRQVRRMCEAVGHPVFALRRTRIGPLADPRLPTGAWRDLAPREVAALQRVAASVAAAHEPMPQEPGTRRPGEERTDRRRPTSASHRATQKQAHPERRTRPEPGTRRPGEERTDRRRTTSASHTAAQKQAHPERRTRPSTRHDAKHRGHVAGVRAPAVRKPADKRKVR